MGLIAVSLVAAVSGLALASPAGAATPEERFRAANELVRASDYPKAIEGYAALARDGHESASLYWNLAQAAMGRGETGRALWALLRARELDPADRSVLRDVDRLRGALNLDPAEIAPEPLAGVARFGRRYRLDLIAVGLLALSLLLHAAGRFGAGRGRPTAAAAITLVLGLLIAAGPIAGAFARPTAVIVLRGAPLFDAASPHAEAVGRLREGEVVPILEASGDWLRVEDNAGARGWVRGQDAWRLDQPAPGV